MLSTIIQGTLCLVLILYNRRSIDESMWQRIRMRAAQVAQEIENQRGELTRDHLLRAASVHLRFVVPEQYAIVVYDDSGRVVVSTVNEPPSGVTAHVDQVLQTRQPVFQKMGSSHLGWMGADRRSGARIGVSPVTLDGARQGVVLLAVTDNYYRQMTGSVERPVLMLIGMGVLASAAAGWLVTGRLLGPLSRLTQLATTLRPEQLELDETEQGPAVAELQNLQDSLRQTRESLRQAFRAQERFLSNVAHELKTPIAVILAEAQTIDRDGMSDDGVRFVESVHEEMKRLGKLVESFLLLAKVHAGKALLKSEVVFINDVLMAAVEQCGIMARQYSVTLVPMLLEGESSNATVAGDPTLLQTMIDGLIRNAIKFSPHGGRVEISACIVDGMVEVCVQDQGPGIAPEIASTLFDRFVQAPSETVRGRGTGLGLAIAQGIAEMHSGRISFQNREDSGCEFSVRLPVAQVDLSETLSNT